MNNVKAIVRCQSREQIEDLIRAWMNDGAQYYKTWIRTPEDAARDMGQKQVLYLDTWNGNTFIKRWSPQSYRDYYKFRYQGEFEGTYLEYMKHTGNVNMAVDVSDYL